MSLAFAQLNLAMLALQDIFEDGVWLPARGSTTAGAVDALFFFVMGICAFFFGVIIILMVLFVIRYRHRPGREIGEETAHHNLALELTWTLIPLVLVIYLFWFGYDVYMDNVVPPPYSMEIQVTGYQWKWLFTHPNGFTDTEMHVPANQPVKLVMSSDDVIHSFFVPDFRLKKDVVPGRYTYAWFEAPEVNLEGHQVFCAEYCGKEHSSMLSRVVVHSQAGYEEWLEKADAFYDEMPPAAAGEEMYRKFGCVQCHSNDGTVNTGPSFKGIFGETHLMTDGSNVLVDENYIRDSILDPQAVIRKGYQGVMPTFQGKLEEKHIRWLIAYIKQLSGVEPEPVAEEPLEVEDLPMEDAGEGELQDESVAGASAPEEDAGLKSGLPESSDAGLNPGPPNDADAPEAEEEQSKL